MENKDVMIELLKEYDVKALEMVKINKLGKLEDIDTDKYIIDYKEKYKEIVDYAQEKLDMIKEDISSELYEILQNDIDKFRRENT